MFRVVPGGSLCTGAHTPGFPCLPPLLEERSDRKSRGYHHSAQGNNTPLSAILKPAPQELGKRGAAVPCTGVSFLQLSEGQSTSSHMAFWHSTFPIVEETRCCCALRPPGKQSCFHPTRLVSHSQGGGAAGAFAPFHHPRHTTECVKDNSRAFKAPFPHPSQASVFSLSCCT